MKERISIHICTYNRPNNLAVCLASLYTQTFKNFDIFIVDDASDPPATNDSLVFQILSFLKNQKHFVKVIRNPTRLGICKSRNIALKADDRNELVLRLDDDSLCESDYVQKLYNVIMGYSTITDLDIVKKIGAVGGIVPYPARAPYYRNSDKLDWFNEIKCDKDGNMTLCADDGHFHWFPNKIIPSHHLRSSWIFRKSAMNEIGGFCEPLGGSTGFREETYTSIQLMDAGYKLYTDTSAKAWHCVAQGKGRNHQERSYEKIVEDHEKWFKNHSKPYLKRLLDGGVIHETK